MPHNAKCMLTAVLLTMSLLAFGQDKIFPVAQEMPTLKGCDELYDAQERHTCTQERIKLYLSDYLKYPEEARKSGEEGYAIITFVVTSKGGIDDLQIKEDPGFGMGEAALKAVKKMGKQWVAGKNKGEVVNVRMTVPVSFKLPDEVEENQTGEAPEVFSLVSEMPRFAGCEDAEGIGSQQCTFEKLTAFIMSNMRYPEEAKKAGVEGAVIIQFVVDEEGKVIRPVVKEGLGSGCDDEAMRLLNSMPTWIPGKQKGKPVKVRMTIPFRFHIRARE